MIFTRSALFQNRISGQIKMSLGEKMLQLTGRGKSGSYNASRFGSIGFSKN